LLAQVSNLDHVLIDDVHIACHASVAAEPPGGLKEVGTHGVGYLELEMHLPDHLSVLCPVHQFLVEQKGLQPDNLDSIF